MVERVIVSVCVQTFNHEPFIRKCLDGFIIQKTNFAFEVLIHEDASTDNTAKIIREYEANYPEIIKPIYQTVNQYSQGINSLTDLLFPIARGKYIAQCEGDDFWTDPLKLQKQVDFLETHPEYSYVCSRFSVLNENTGEQKGFADDFFADGKDKLITTDNFFNPYISKTLTVLFRAKLIEKINSNFKSFSDLFLFFQLLQYGNAYCLSEDMGVYRLHSGGVWSSISRITNSQISYNMSFDFVRIYGNKYNSIKKFHESCYGQHLVDIIDNKSIVAFIRMCFKEFKLYFYGYQNYFTGTIKMSTILLRWYLNR